MGESVSPSFARELMNTILYRTLPGRIWVALPLVAVALLTACDESITRPPPARLDPGTWGGDGAGLIVEDSIAHVHIGCTFGNFPPPAAVDQNGRFSVAGSYVLRAYPIQIGPPLPAELSGQRRAGELTLTVAVDDTVRHERVVLGPVVVTLGTPPRLGPCPICVVPPRLDRAAPFAVPQFLSRSGFPTSLLGSAPRRGTNLVTQPPS